MTAILAAPAAKLAIGAAVNLAGGIADALSSQNSKAKKTAADFETVFLENFTQTMMNSSGTEGPLGENGVGGDVWRSMLTQEYAKQMQRAGGVGLSDQIMRDLIQSVRARRPPDRREPAMVERLRVVDERPRVSNAVEAETLIEAVMETLGALSHVVGEETGLVKAGRLKDAMERETRKAELAGVYMKGVEQIKLNAVALARFAPDRVKRLKNAHLAFQELIDLNQTVLATARAISESIMRDLAADANRQNKAPGYGPTAAVGAGVFARPNAGPLVLSKSL